MAYVISMIRFQNPIFFVFTERLRVKDQFINESCTFLISAGDITQKGFEKKRARLLQPYLDAANSKQGTYVTRVAMWRFSSSRCPLLVGLADKVIQLSGDNIPGDYERERGAFK